MDKEQLKEYVKTLRKKYGEIETISCKSANKLRTMFDEIADNDLLKILYYAQIKWVSVVARNRLIQRRVKF